MTKHPFEFVPIPAERIMDKPRRNGRTMMIDWGLDLPRQRGILDLLGRYVDIAKIPIGTPRLYDEAALGEKFALYRDHQVLTMVGGGFVEHVYATQGEGALDRLFAETKRVGFDILEISDNYIPLSKAQRQAQIRLGQRHGLIVFGEVGSKHAKSDAATLIGQAEDCFEAGAEVVLLEGAEFVEDGRIVHGLIDALGDGLDMSRALIEVPGPWISGIQLSMVQDLIKLLIQEFGPNVNLANVMPDDVIHTEALRVGLGVVQPTKPLAAAG
jgi:phosphosulfolactate synthase